MIIGDFTWHDASPAIDEQGRWFVVDSDRDNIAGPFAMYTQALRWIGQQHIVEPASGLCDVIRGISDDYMTSEAHHPGYVLIPTAKFEKLRLAEEALPCDDRETRFANDAAAKALYDTWSYRDGWVPWVERGNSQMQDVARTNVAILAAKTNQALALSFECKTCSVAEPVWCMLASCCPHRDGPADAAHQPQTP